QSRRARRTARRRQVSLTSPAAVVVTMPVVDINNNTTTTSSSSNLTVPIAAPVGSPLVLDRVAILKAFAAVTQEESTTGSNLGISNSGSSSSSNTAGRTSRYEKPTSYREA